MSSNYLRMIGIEAILDEILQMTRDFVTRDVFFAVCSHIVEYGIAPSNREVAHSLNVTHTTVRRKLKLLRSLGYLDYEDGKPRTVRIVRYTVNEQGNTELINLIDRQVDKRLEKHKENSFENRLHREMIRTGILRS